MFEYLRSKIFAISSQYNRIDPNAELSSSAYCSGSYIGGGVVIGEGSKIYQSHIEGIVKVGRYSSIWGPSVHVIGRVHGINIGNFCSIARHVSIQEDFHNTSRTSTYFLERNVFGEEARDNAIVSKGQIVVGHDVWIGSGAQILSGVNIGHGAVVAAGSIVTKDVPPYAIVAGNPGQVLRYRFQESTIQELLDTAWWYWPIDKIHEQKRYLLADRS